MLIGAAWADHFISPGINNLPKKLLHGSIGLILFVFTVGPILIRSYPGTMSPKPFPYTGAGDATLDITGWEQLLPAFEKLRNDAIANGQMAPDAPMVVHKWFPGSHVYYHVAYPLGMRTVGIGHLEDLHHFCLAQPAVRASRSRRRRMVHYPFQQFQRSRRAICRTIRALRKSRNHHTKAQRTSSTLLVCLPA